MKIFETFAIKKSSCSNLFLLIPHPFISDIYDIIEDFNEANNEIENGKVLMDLQTIVGNRKKKYVQLNVENFKLIRKTLESTNNLNDELQSLKKDYYSSLDKRILAHITPLFSINQCYI